MHTNRVLYTAWQDLHLDRAKVMSDSAQGLSFTKQISLREIFKLKDIKHHVDACILD